MDTKHSESRKGSAQPAEIWKASAGEGGRILTASCMPGFASSAHICHCFTFIAGSKKKLLHDQQKQILRKICPILPFLAVHPCTKLWLSAHSSQSSALTSSLLICIRIRIGLHIRVKIGPYSAKLTVSSQSCSVLKCHHALMHFPTLANAQ